MTFCFHALSDFSLQCRLLAGGHTNTVTVNSYVNTTWKARTILQSVPIKIKCFVDYAGGKILGKTIYLGFYANETEWDSEQVEKVKVWKITSCIPCNYYCLHCYASRVFA